MNTGSLNSYSPIQKLHPLSLLARVTSRKVTGCLRIFSGETIWSIYLDQGALIYATNSMEQFDRLDRHLRQLSRQIPSIVSALRVQVRLMFEKAQESKYRISADYHAIGWLVEQQHLSLEQAARLIEELAKEVIESLLLVNEGSYELLEKERFDEWINFCQLDLRLLTEHCQSKLQQYQTLGSRQSPLAKKPEITQKPEGRSPEIPPTLSNKIRANLPAPDAELNGSTVNSDSKKSLKDKYTIVCVDDSPTILNTIKNFLDDMSFSIVAVNDPLKALMQVVRSKPDLILLDVGMPNLDGYELCSLLRKNQSFKMTPIIMVTGNTGFIDRAKAKLVGASGYLTKPFTQPELLKMVFKYLK